MRTSLAELAALLLALTGLALYSAEPDRKPGSATQENGQEGQGKSVSAALELAMPRRFVPGEVIVKRKPGPLRTLGAQQVGPLGLETEPRQISGGAVVYRIPPAAMGTLSEAGRTDRTLTAVQALQHLPDVEYAQPNYIYRIVSTTPSDRRYPDQWHYFTNGSGSGSSLGGIGLPSVWDTNIGKSSVVVAVIDTGILPNHPDIIGSPNLLAGYDMISNPVMANDGDGRDPDPTDPGDAVQAGECGDGWPPSPLPNSWHGTHVAGTIGVGRTNHGAVVAGVNWNVKVQPVRVLGKCGGTTADIADGIRWAAGITVPGVPDNPTKAAVINMSLGGDGSCSNDPLEQNAINDAVSAGVTVVVAAGNEARDASLDTPASCNNVITVAASDARGFLVTRYSNFGSKVKIMAPGGDVKRDDNGDGKPDGVLSMVSPTDGTYAYYNGTSMAAPHVAGVAALLKACNPAMSPSQVLAKLQSGALSRNSTQCPRACGAGLLDARVASCGAPPTQPSGQLSLLLAPPSVNLHQSGSRTTTLVATVKRDGTAVVGETVSFASDNTSVASVSPASAVTNTLGQAEVTVNAQQKGDTDIRASASGATAQSHARVPVLSSTSLLLLALGAFVAFLLRLLK